MNNLNKMTYVRVLVVYRASSIYMLFIFMIMNKKKNMNAKQTDTILYERNVCCSATKS